MDALAARRRGRRAPRSRRVPLDPDRIGAGTRVRAARGTDHGASRIDVARAEQRRAYPGSGGSHLSVCRPTMSLPSSPRAACRSTGTMPEQLRMRPWDVPEGHDGARLADARRIIAGASAK